MNQNLSVQQSQRQILDTSLLQLIDIITMPTEELRERIKNEAINNPTIELKERENYIDDYSINSREATFSQDEANSSYYRDEGENNWFERTISEKENLEEHLLKQLGCLDIDKNTKEAAETIISSLDEYGFTGPDPERLLPERQKKYLSSALSAIKSLEPTGVGAEDWREALLIQIKEIEKNKDERKRYKDIIYRGLDYIKDNKLDQLARALKIGREDLDAMLSVIKTLTPFPGLKYNADYTSFVLPELSFHVVDDTLIMKLINNNLPVVKVDNSYKEMREELKKTKSEKEKEASKYLSENINSAQNLISMLEMRENTLLKLGSLLCQKQKDFFFYGPLFLKPLTMTECAQELGVNVSTISKMAQKKYVETDWGNMTLRYFFSSEVKKDNGEDLSKNAVKEKIREIIENNTSSKALSDQKISDKLKEEGITLARRTVAKYRSEMALDPTWGKKKS